jgi:hypothetical protein
MLTIPIQQKRGYGAEVVGHARLATGFDTGATDIDIARLVLAVYSGGAPRAADTEQRILLLSV